MDSLLANYASSDEEDDHDNQQEEPQPPPPPHRQAPQNPNPPRRSLLSSLPPPKSSSSKFRSFPSPEWSSSSSLFASLPRPKPDPPSTAVNPKPPKKVVQFRPPIDPAVFDEDDDSDKEEKKETDRKKDPGQRRTIASILPPPQHSLSSAPPGRRIAVEAEERTVVASEGGKREIGDTGSEKAGGEEFAGYYGGWGSTGVGAGGEASGWAQGDGSYGDYGGSWDYGAAEVSGATTEAAPAVEMDVGRMVGKRGRNEIPTEILEVKQEELVKDRPREDQLKMTGITFGPAYQPVSSAKGKPSKLHKRKHQIGSLFYDMKQKEQELMERRARGTLTKRETQGKYGW